VARTPPELLAAFPTVEQRFGPCFVQDFVPQTGTQYKVDLWFLTSRNRFKQLASWLDFFSPNVTYQIFSARDLGPLLGYLLENLMLGRRAMSSRLRLGQATHR
jgi:hypothetical protein